MIYVNVSVRVKPGKRQEFIDLFNSFAVTIRKEKGCIQFIPAVDLETGMPPQSLDKNMVTILERWEGLEALKAHLAMPYMADFFAKQQPLVEETVSMKILKEA